MRVLVLGANGFVGRHAVARLEDAGHEVLRAGRAPEPHERDVAAVDVRDRAAVFALIARLTPDAILHLAGLAFVPLAAREPQLAFEVNALGTLHVLDAALAAVPRARVVVASSAHVYGRAAAERMPLAEDEPMRPVTLYGATKAAAEHLCAVRAGDGQEVVVLRPFNQVGPGQEESFVVASFAAQIARLERGGGGALHHGNLDVARDFLDVRDAALAYERVLAAPAGSFAPFQPLNLCSGRAVTVREVLDRMLAAANLPIARAAEEARARADDVPVFVGDPTRLRDAIGFAPRIPLERTLADALEHARTVTAPR